MIQVFISYARKDQTKAREILKALKSKTKRKTKARFWMDENALRAGQHWPEKIKEAIQNSQFVIALLSRSARAPMSYVRNEIEWALNHAETAIPKGQIYLVPIRLEDIRLARSRHPFDKLHNRQHVDYFPRKKNKEQAMRKVAGIINDGPQYFSDLQRAERLVREVAQFADECRTVMKKRKTKQKVEVRMRAAFTSMTNIEHYHNKDIPYRLPEQRRALDKLLVRERKAIDDLLSLENVHLKCICWPKIRFLGKNYSDEERQKRIALFDAFLSNSMKRFVDRREIVADENGSHGNQLILGRKFAMTANPESGGYSKTSVFDERQMVDVLIREYDNLFSSIKRAKFRISQKHPTEDQKREMIEDAMSWFMREKAIYAAYGG